MSGIAILITVPIQRNDFLWMLSQNLGHCPNSHFQWARHNYRAHHNMVKAKTISALRKKSIKTSVVIADVVRSLESEREKKLHEPHDHSSAPVGKAPKAKAVNETETQKKFELGSARDAKISASLSSSGSEAAESSSSTRTSADTVYVEGLPFTATEEDVIKFFSTCGTVRSVRLPRWHDSGKLRG